MTPTHLPSSPRPGPHCLFRRSLLLECSTCIGPFTSRFPTGVTNSTWASWRYHLRQNFRMLLLIRSPRSPTGPGRVRGFVSHDAKMRDKGLHMASHPGSVNPNQNRPSLHAHQNGQQKTEHELCGHSTVLAVTPQQHHDAPPTAGLHLVHCKPEGSCSWASWHAHTIYMVSSPASASPCRHRHNTSFPFSPEGHWENAQWNAACCI